MLSKTVKAVAKRYITDMPALVKKEGLYLLIKCYNNQSNAQSLNRNILIKTNTELNEHHIFQKNYILVRV